MLKSLEIKNYALIDHLEMAPSQQLNMITGETGAGKSIMLGAVGLLMGNRADTKVLLSQENKCIVEGIFDISSYRQLKIIFEQEDIEYDSQSIIRREISPSGKSRAFVNDQPVILDVLRKIGPRLIDIHSQHETLQLGSNQFQVYLIDLFAETGDVQNSYRQSYNNFISQKREYEELVKNAANLSKDHDYNSFLLQELQEAQLDTINQVEIEQQLITLENAEEIKSHLNEIINGLDRSDFSASNIINQVQAPLNKLSKLSTDFDTLHDRLESCRIELKDIVNELQEKEDRVEHDPEKIIELQGKLGLLYKLMQKHQVETTDALIKLREDFDAKVNQSSNIDEQLEKSKLAVEEAKIDLMDKGEKLSSTRKAIFSVLEKRITELLAEVGINDASISVNIERTEPTKTGLDHIDILFSANKGIPPQEIKHVTSGGEFSRLMFCLKYLLAHKTKLPTIIFDEIDTGVSGEIALKMVRMMKKMAQNHQIVSISHLPQFAAQGDSHYYVYKDSSETRAVSKIRKLDGDERILEIAKMIGGDQPSNTAVVNARELMTI